MNTKPILFSGPMILAILAGRKTQTRRVVKSTAWVCDGGEPPSGSYPGSPGQWVIDLDRCPYGKIGDRLWVRETWCETDDEYGTPVVVYRAGGNRLIGRDHPRGPDYLLNASSDEGIHVDRWKPSIYMPRWASRISLKITNVRVERVQDISEEDAIEEGMQKFVYTSKDNVATRKYGIPDRDGFPGEGDFGWPWHDWKIFPTAAFARLWDCINANRGQDWKANPWVWVIEFDIAK